MCDFFFNFEIKSCLSTSFFIFRTISQILETKFYVHCPWNRLSALHFAGSWFQLKVAYDSSVRPGLPCAATRPLGRPTSRAGQGRNKAIPPPNNADSQVRPRRRTAGAGPDAISTGPRCCPALHAHRAHSSSSLG